jgi:CRISPR-associated protein Csb1
MPEIASPDFKEFDALLRTDGPVLLVAKQLLGPASIDDEKTESVFPPSYANPSGKKDDPPVYNIDVLDPWDPSKNVCVLDSIPSQANRMEPLFSQPPYDKLIPQYSVKFNDELPVFNITQIGHRLADAAFRGTTLRSQIVEAFKAFAKGDASKIARLGPTSLVFGAWDSRGIGVKVPRLINSIIRAFNVREIKRSAQYTPPIKYEQEGLIPAGLEGKPSDHGLADVPSPRTIGGVHVYGDIRRDFSLNLELLRELRGANADETQKLQRYVLGLALIAFTATQKTSLRQGCQLLPKGEPEWRQFCAKGKDEPWIAPVNVEVLVEAAAKGFGIAQPTDQPLQFDKARLKASIDSDAKKKADKKAASAGDPIANLRTLVDELRPATGDKFSTSKSSTLTRLQQAVAKIEEDTSADETLKKLAGKLKPLLTADPGAATRKQQMLALFSTIDQNAPAEAATTNDETSPEAAQ